MTEQQILTGRPGWRPALPGETPGQCEPELDAGGKGQRQPHTQAPNPSAPPCAGADFTVGDIGGQYDTQAPLTNVALARAQMGVAYLAEAFPGWLSRADARAAARALDVRTNYACPWSIAADAVFDPALTADDIVAFGFVPGEGVTAAELNDAWTWLLSLMGTDWEVIE